jgi:hypothetical protein
MPFGSIENMVLLGLLSMEDSEVAPTLPMAIVHILNLAIRRTCDGTQLDQISRCGFMTPRVIIFFGQALTPVTGIS